MRRITSLSIALGSLLALSAAERPRYGGELRIELHAPLRNVDVADVPTESLEAAAKEKVLGQVFETIARVAASWTRDVPRKQWIFQPRPNATWHDGRPVEPFSMPDATPIESLLLEKLVRKNDDGVPVGTGPFRIVDFDGKRIRLAAHVGHWGGRPYLDNIDIAFNRTLREQALAFDVGSADVIETPWNETRRARQRPGRTVQSTNIELLALIFDAAKAPQPVREAVALSLDRASIHSVLLQKQGAPSGALLPQWLSGWAFVFPVLRDLAKARALGTNATLSFAYDRQDPLLRAIAERIALNTAEAGVSLKPAATPSADVRLAHLRISPASASQAIRELASAFRVPPNNDAFATERLLLEGSRIIPLFHLPASYHVSERVRNWQGPWVQSDRWDLAEVWLREAKP
jgi:peptide/nickel transport system substrate-binding protein